MLSHKVSTFSLRLLVFGLALQAFFLLSTLFLLLDLGSADLTVPFNNWGDTTWFTVVVKGMVDNGWTYIIPQLSAPFELHAAAFPAMTHADWVVMKLLSFFNPEPGAIINLFWLCSIVFAGWLAAVAMTLLGIEVWLACIMGALYAFLPFAFFRNVAHITLVYYCVPGICALAVWIAGGCPELRSRCIKSIGFLALFVQALNYIYYSFFALLILAVAGWRGAIVSNSARPIRTALVAIVFTLSFASINLTPSFLSWHQEGKPPDMGYKHAAEAEIYGLKLRTMLTPSKSNLIPPFSDWAQKNRSTPFPNENENVTARLGPMAALGLIYLTLISLGLVKARVSRPSRSVITNNLAFLSLFTLLFVTVGGLGSLFNLLVLPEFRAYNRFSVFIAFFVLSGFALWWQSAFERMRCRASKRALL